MAKKKVVKVKDAEPIVGEPEEFLDEDEHADTHTEHSTKLRIGDKDTDIYTEEGRDELQENDELSPSEEGFAEGAEGPEEPMCAQCGKILGDRETTVIEKEIKGKTLLFCSEKCAGAGKKGKGK